MAIAQTGIIYQLTPLDMTRLAVESTVWEQLTLNFDATHSFDRQITHLPAAHINLISPKFTYQPRQSTPITAPNIEKSDDPHQWNRLLSMAPPEPKPAPIQKKPATEPRLPESVPMPIIRAPIQAESNTGVAQPTKIGFKVTKPLHTRFFALGVTLVMIALFGLGKAILPTVQAEFSYRMRTLAATQATRAIPAKVPKIFDPLIAPDGTAITPLDTNFGIVVPSIGINSPVIPAVDPSNQKDYEEALQHGVAHAATSFFPNENGVVYLFSHSTNYDWFVKDLNAVFYLLKNLKPGDPIVILYQGKRYTYTFREKQIVGPKEVGYLMPVYGKKMLILQTCWPPGSVEKRLLLFADFVEEAQLEI